MPRRAPTIEEILTAFEAEAATAVRFASVDRDLLQRLIDDHRRLSEVLHESRDYVRSESMAEAITEALSR